jgi:hypothetical protein
VIVIAISSALLIVCLSGCDFTFICVVVCVEGLTMDAPSIYLYNLFIYLSIYLSPYLIIIIIIIGYNTRRSVFIRMVR